MEFLTRKRNGRRGVFKRKLMINEYEYDSRHVEIRQRPDMSQKVYNIAKEAFLKNIQEQVQNRHSIERSTIHQAQSVLWVTFRKRLLTASWFSKVCKSRPTTNPAGLVNRMLYSYPLNHIPSIRHGMVNEEKAIRQLQIQEQVCIERCGLFVDEELFFLGASPDGLITDYGVVEIKCPSSAYGLEVDDAIRLRKITFWKVDGTVNRRHDWFYQVQGQLHVTKRSFCLFAVWTGKQLKMKTEIVMRDDAFWEESMKVKLVDFYHKCLLPEMVDPRESRSLALRDSLP